MSMPSLTLPGTSTPLAPSALQTHIGFWLRAVSNHVSHAFARKLLASGVTVAEWVVLREMFSLGPIAPSHIAHTTGLTRGAISKLIDRLLEKQLITREGRDDDRRFQTVALTPRARRLVPTLAALADRNDAEFFSALTSTERVALRTILNKLAQAHSLSKPPID